MSEQKVRKQKQQFQIGWPPEVTLKVYFPHRRDTDRCRIDYEGCSEAEAVMYLRHAYKSLDGNFRPSQKQGANPEDHLADPEAVFVRCQQWDMFDSDTGGRIMITGTDEPHRADFIREWPKWPIEEFAKMEEAFSPRHPKITRMQRINFTQNLEYIDKMKSVERLFGAWRDKTVWIVGSGPSLRDTAEHIPTGDDHVVIAINRAARILDPEQIDFVTVMDKQSDIEKWAPEEVREKKLLMSMMVPVRWVEEFEDVYVFRSPRVELSPDPEQEKEISHLPYLANCLHSTYSTFHLAYLAGAKRICFTGQDFSASSDWFYADEEMTMERWESRRWEIKQDLRGIPVLTNRKLMRSANIMRGQAMFLAADGVEVINYSGRGIMDFEDSPCVENEQVDELTSNRDITEDYGDD